MNLINQRIFIGTPPEVKSASMDAKGRIWLFECLKKHLSLNHQSWTSDIETAFYYADTAAVWLDICDWQNSAIDRESTA